MHAHMQNQLALWADSLHHENSICPLQRWKQNHSWEVSAAAHAKKPCYILGNGTRTCFPQVFCHGPMYKFVLQSRGCLAEPSPEWILTPSRRVTWEVSLLFLCLQIESCSQISHSKNAAVRWYDGSDDVSGSFAFHCNEGHEQAIDIPRNWHLDAL